MAGNGSAADRVAAEPGLLDELEGVVQEEARLLDEGRWEEWLGLYDEDGWYWVPHRHDQPNPQEEISIFYDDRMLMETRVRRLEAERSHAQSPGSRTSRVVGRPRVEKSEGDGSEYVLTSKFVMLEHRIDAQHVWGGSYTHCLRRNGKGWRIAWKRVDLVNAEGVLDSISIPF